MPSYKKLDFVFPFDIPTEIQNLQEHEVTREIPDKTCDGLLLGSWRITNLGLQQRTNDHYELIAEIISWFDIVAIQEVKKCQPYKQLWMSATNPKYKKPGILRLVC